MFTRLFTSAALAGLATGVMSAGLTLFLVVPLILEGELFESGLITHFVTTANGAIQTTVDPVSLSGNLARHAQTFAISLVTYIGFALLLVTGFALAERSGARIDTRTGLLWGTCGFLAVHLAPAVGLPPELPGTIGADLASRQIWWLGTVAASIAGLALIGYARNPAMILGGVALLAAPHLIGAPGIDTYFGVAPPELAAHFVTSALGVAAVSWAILGASAGWLWSRGD